MRLRKRMIPLFLLLAMLLGACGTQQPVQPDVPNQLQPDENNTQPPPAVETVQPELRLNGWNIKQGSAAFEIENIYCTETVYPTLGTDAARTASSGRKYLVVAASVRNLRNGAAMADELLTMAATIDGSSYAADCVAESVGGRRLEFASIMSVAALDTIRMCYLFEIPQETEVTEIRLAALLGDEMRDTTFQLSDFAADRPTVFLGNDLITAGECSLTLAEAEYTATFSPLEDHFYNETYEAPEGETFLILRLTATNLSDKALPCDTLVGLLCQYGAQQYPVECGVLAGDDYYPDPANRTLAPLESGTLCYRISLPQEAAEDSGIQLCLRFGGEVYTIQ